MNRHDSEGVSTCWCPVGDDRVRRRAPVPAAAHLAMVAAPPARHPARMARRHRRQSSGHVLLIGPDVLTRSALETASNRYRWLGYARAKLWTSSLLQLDSGMTCHRRSTNWRSVRPNWTRMSSSSAPPNGAHLEANSMRSSASGVRMPGCTVDVDPSGAAPLSPWAFPVRVHGIHISGRSRMHFGVGGPFDSAGFGAVPAVWPAVRIRTQPRSCDVDG